MGPGLSLCSGARWWGCLRQRSSLEGLSKPLPGTVGIVYFLTRSSERISPGSDSTCAPDSGASGKLWLGPGLGGSRPNSHCCPLGAPTGAPLISEDPARDWGLGPVGGEPSRRALQTWQKGDPAPPGQPCPALLRQHTHEPSAK